MLANEPGTLGGALTRGKSGEQLEDVCDTFPHFFCPHLREYVGREAELPFDQHHLLALIAPRKLYVASAAQDLWADPVSEFLGCCAADTAWRAGAAVPRPAAPSGRGLFRRLPGLPCPPRRALPQPV